MAIWIDRWRFLQFRCGVDCFDRGGRDAFVLIALAAPLGVVGAALIIASSVRDVREGHPPARAWRLAIKVMRFALGLGAGVAAVVAIALFVAAFQEFASPTTVDGVAAYSTPASLAVFGALWGGATWSGWAVVRRVNRLLRDWGKTAG